jgi:phosphatidylserine synthase
LLTVTTIPYAKARAGFRNPILFGIIILIITIVFRFFENDLWESIWYLAFALYMSYFALIPALIAKGTFDE